MVFNKPMLLHHSLSGELSGVILAGKDTLLLVRKDTLLLGRKDTLFSFLNFSAFSSMSRTLVPNKQMYAISRSSWSNVILLLFRTDLFFFESFFTWKSVPTSSSSLSLTRNLPLGFSSVSKKSNLIKLFDLFEEDRSEI